MYLVSMVLPVHMLVSSSSNSRIIMWESDPLYTCFVGVFSPLQGTGHVLDKAKVVNQY